MLDIRADSSGIFFCFKVLSTWMDPIPGWIDNMNGPTKLILAASLGMVRSTYVDRSKVTDMVPVDMVVNAIIATAWETSFRR
jgi:fatty acyl-CoA reductase